MSYYFTIATFLLVIGIVGATRDVVLRGREIQSPGIRAMLVEAGRRVGPAGRFVVLNGSAIKDQGREAALLSYYLRRYVSGPVSWGGVGESAQPAGLVAVMTVAIQPGRGERNGFAAFEGGFDPPLRPIWSRVGRTQRRTRSYVTVNVYDVPASTDKSKVAGWAVSGPE